MSNRIYSAEHVEYIAANIPGRGYKELTAMFNKQFGMTLRISAMISLADRHGLHNGRDCRFNKGWEPTQFKKGHLPANKGRKGIDGWGPTQFKKGHRPFNYKPVGTERINGDGYVDIKIADPNKWRAKHLLIWEEANGPVPKGHAVLFGDGNRSNIDLNNLILVSRKELAVLNHKRLIHDDAELTKSGILIAKLLLKSSERKKKSKGKKLNVEKQLFHERRGQE